MNGVRNSVATCSYLSNSHRLSGYLATLIVKYRIDPYTSALYCHGRFYALFASNAVDVGTLYCCWHDWHSGWPLPPI